MMEIDSSKLPHRVWTAAYLQRTHRQRYNVSDVIQGHGRIDDAESKNEIPRSARGLATREVHQSCSARFRYWQCHDGTCPQA